MGVDSRARAPGGERIWNGRRGSNRYYLDLGGLSKAWVVDGKWREEGAATGPHGGRLCQGKLKLPRWFTGKESACQCRGRGFCPWVRKSSYRRE